MSSFSSDMANRDYEVKLGNYFSRGWEIFKPKAPMFVLYTLLLVMAQVVLALLPFPIGANSEEPVPGGIGNLIFNIISPALGAGYYFVAFQVARGRGAVFGDFFLGFNKFLPLFLTSLISALLIFLGTLALILPGIYLAVAYLFAQPLVVDKNAGFWQAMEISRKLVTKKWFSFLALVISLVLMNIAGALLLGIGLLVTLPLSVCIVSAAYEDIVGLNAVAEA
jgi:hypothetical protein